MPVDRADELRRQDQRRAEDRDATLPGKVRGSFIQTRHIE